MDIKEKYDELIKLVEEADFVDFAPFGSGVNESLILKAEKYLGLLLPPSYKWWLLHFSGGEIYHQEIYSLYDSGLSEEFSGGDICYMNKINTQKGWTDNGKRLFISQPSGCDEWFYFKPSNDLEWSVFKCDSGLNHEQLYSKSFVEFLIKRIEEWFDE